MKKTVENRGSRGSLSGRVIRSYLSHWNEEGRLNGRKPDHSKKPGGSYCNNPSDIMLVLWIKMVAVKMKMC